MTRKRLWAVFIFALAPRLFFWQNSEPLRPDSQSYLSPAQSLALGSGFLGVDGRPDTVRTPGYPLFLAAHRLTRAPAGVTQCLIDSGTAVLVSLTAAALVGHPSAWLAGFLYALDPVAAANAPLILSETWFTFLLMAGVWLSLFQSPLSGLFCGLATLTRPISVYLWLPWSVVFGRRRAWLFILLALLPPALWCGRNYKLYGSFELSSITGINFLFWEGAAVKARAEGLSFEAARAQLVSEEPLTPEPPFARSARQKAKGQAIMRAHPKETLEVHAVYTLKMLLGPGVDAVAQGAAPSIPLPQGGGLGGGTRRLLSERPLLWFPALWTMGLLALCYGLATVGVWRLGRASLPVLIPLVYLIVISGGGWAYYRFRIPMMPLLAVLAAGALRYRSSSPSDAGRAS